MYWVFFFHAIMQRGALPSLIIYALVSREQTKIVYFILHIINCLLFMLNGNYFMCDHFDSNRTHTHWTHTHITITYCYWNSFTCNSLCVHSWTLTFCSILWNNCVFNDTCHEYIQWNIDMGELDFRAVHLLFRFWSILSLFIPLNIQFNRTAAAFNNQFHMNRKLQVQYQMKIE